MADIWKQAEDRLRWVAVLPLLSMNQVFEEAKFSKENRARTWSVDLKDRKIRVNVIGVRGAI